MDQFTSVVTGANTGLGRATAQALAARAPGPIESVIKRFRPTPETGAKTSVRCATSAEVLDHRGAYYSVLKRKEPSKAATPELAAELWRRSEAWTWA